MSNENTTQITREPMPYGSVLLVDDVETNLFVARGLLLPYKLTIDTVMSGFEAVDKIKAGSVYDIVFMDHLMPKMDGIETTKIMREWGYTAPIVALTANTVEGQAEMFLTNGFDDFISKPIDERQLNEVLNKLIRDKQPHDVLEAAQTGSLQKNAGAAPQSSLDTELAKVFTRDAERAVKTLEAICQKGIALEESDLQTYTITTHAMKSALANIGEAEFSGIARRLEAAGREHNIAIVTAETPVFLDDLRAVIKRITSLEKDEGSDIVDEDTAFLHEKMVVFQAACKVYDKKTAKEALIALNKQKWSRQTKEKLNILTEHLLHSDFDEALSIASEL